MKKIKLGLILATIMLGTEFTSAQKWIQGKDLSYLKGQREILLKFSYDNMKAGKKSESEYIAEKKADYNQKEPGKGDKWARAWEDNKEAIYEPKFEELFNKVSGEDLAGDRNRSEAKYTMVLHVTRMEPGWNVGISKMPASCDFEIQIVETANPSVVKSKGVLKNVPGSQFSGYDFDVASRMQECFAKAGKVMGKKLGKASKS